MQEVKDIRQVVSGQTLVVIGYDHHNFAEKDPQGYWTQVVKVTACGTEAELSGPGVDENSTPRLEAFWAQRPAIQVVQVSPPPGDAYATLPDLLLMEDEYITTGGMGSVRVQVYAVEVECFRWGQGLSGTLPAQVRS